MGLIKNGVYYSDKAPEPPKSSPEYKRWSHQEQYRAHQGDLIQRYKQGKPNGEFIRAYPEESKLQFDDKTIRQFGNSYD